MDPSLSVTATIRQALAICARNWRTLAAWLPLTALLMFLTLFLPFVAMLFAAVCLSYVLGRRSKGEPATLIDGLRVAVRRFSPVLICSVALGLCFTILVSGMFTLPVLAYLGARVIVLPPALAFEHGSSWDALKRAWSLTGTEGSRSLRLAAVMAAPALVASLPFLAGYVLILTPFISPEGGHDLSPLVIALWGSAAAIFLLWLPVMVAAQTLAYAKLTLPDAEAEKALV